MCVKQFAYGFSLVLGVGVLLSCGGASAAPPPPQAISNILYIVDSGSVATYSIDPNALAATPVEQPVVLVPSPATLLQFDPSPDDQFVYAVWSDAQTVQHLSVFQTDTFGVPQLPAIQVLDANSLSQFNMHPVGRFAYMLEVTSNKGLYSAAIRLFNVKPDGKLKENPQVQGTYGPAVYWPAFIYGFSPNGSMLYDTSPLSTGSVYRQRAINQTNGGLGSDNPLITLNGSQEIVIGQLIADLHQADSNLNQGYLDIFPSVPNPKLAIHCTIAMLSYCATASNIQLDRTGRYLFLTDPATSAVHVAAIKLRRNKILDAGSSMPMTSQTPGFAFNQSGSIVYAIQTDGNIHFFHFDATSGTLTEGGAPLPIAAGSGICPAHR
mgnify:CR=1 FL=1